MERLSHAFTDWGEEAALPPDRALGDPPSAMVAPSPDDGGADDLTAPDDELLAELTCVRMCVCVSFCIYISTIPNKAKKKKKDDEEADAEKGKGAHGNTSASELRRRRHHHLPKHSTTCPSPPPPMTADPAVETNEIAFRTKEKRGEAVMIRTRKEEGEKETGQAPRTGRILAGRPEPAAAMAGFHSVV
ncbi:uncharacterized protein J3R85_009891 [Psidium guajava]|nr:uncharacterized protein J3R85_009891 [Psidium guajava]